MGKDTINKNGCSVCEPEQEIYTSFAPLHRPRQTFIQYDYRTKDGKLFSCVKPDLMACRDARDKWLKSEINENR